MTAYQEARIRWFSESNSVGRKPDKEKASGRQPQSFSKQSSNSNNTISLNAYRVARKKGSRFRTMSDDTGDYCMAREARGDYFVPLPEDLKMRGAA